MVNLKFCYQNEIHKCSNIPEDYASLIETIQTIFKNNLNTPFELQYEDSDGDNIMLSSQEDYEAMLESENKNGNSIKIFITNKGDNQIFQLRDSINDSVDSNTDTNANLIQKLSQVENYQVIDKKLPQEEIKSDDVEFIVQKTGDLNLEPLPVIKEIQIKEDNPQIIKCEDLISNEQNQAIPMSRVEQDVQTVQEQSTQETQTQVNNTSEFPIQTDISMNELNDSFMKRSSVALHKDVLCNGCGEMPITGIRYKCSVCDQFNFCELCEQTIDHIHSFIKIKNPTQEYGIISGCGFKNKLNFIQSQYRNLRKSAIEQTEEISGFVKNMIGIKPNNQEESKEPVKVSCNNNQSNQYYVNPDGLYDAKILEYAEDGTPTVIHPEYKIKKRMKIRNTGLLNFPKDTYIRELNSESNFKINIPEVEVNQEYAQTFMLPCIHLTGNHITHWVIAFKNENNVEEFIGKPIELSFLVVKPTKDVATKLKCLRDVFPGKENQEYLDIINNSKNSTIDEIIANLL